MKIGPHLGPTWRHWVNRRLYDIYTFGRFLRCGSGARDAVRLALSMLHTHREETGPIPAGHCIKMTLYVEEDSADMGFSEELDGKGDPLHPLPTIVDDVRTASTDHTAKLTQWRVDYGR